MSSDPGRTIKHGLPDAQCCISSRGLFDPWPLADARCISKEQSHSHKEDGARGIETVPAAAAAHAVQDEGWLASRSKEDHGLEVVDGGLPKLLLLMTLYMKD